MGIKKNRLETLRLLLANGEITRQDTLLQELDKHGYTVTQATLSRDLRTLKAAKVAGPKGYVYVLPESPLYRRPVSQSALSEFFKLGGFVSLKFSGNLAVIHTRPGFASSLAAEIDTHDLPFIVGSIAGDDTVIMVLAEDVDRTWVKEVFASFIPGLDKKEDK